MTGTQGKPPAISFVIPVYRSEQTILGVVEEIFREFGEAEVIAVVDGSPDAVAPLLRDWGARHPQCSLTVVELRRNRGQHFAVLQGFRLIRSPVVATIDDDGQNPAAEYHRLTERLREQDLDCVYGAFERTAQPRLRRWLSRLNIELSVHFMGNRAGLPISNVRVLRSDLALALTETPTPYPFIDALIFRATSHVDAVPVEQRRRAAGGSTYSLAQLVFLGISHATIFSTLPLVVAAAAGLCAGGVTLVAALSILLLGRLGVVAAGEWSFLVAIISLLFSLSFAALGLLSVYVGRLYVAFNSTPRPYIRSGVEVGTARER